MLFSIDKGEVVAAGGLYWALFCHLSSYLDRNNMNLFSHLFSRLGVLVQASHLLGCSRRQCRYPLGLVYVEQPTSFNNYPASVSLQTVVSKWWPCCSYISRC